MVVIFRQVFGKQDAKCRERAHDFHTRTVLHPNDQGCLSDGLRFDTSRAILEPNDRILKGIYRFPTTI